MGSSTMDPDGQGSSEYDFSQQTLSIHQARTFSDKTRAESLEKCVKILKQFTETKMNSDIEEKRKKMRENVKANFVHGIRRSRNHETTMLFMESGKRHRPWYTWYVSAVVAGHPDRLHDILWKPKKGQRTEDVSFEMRSFKRRKRPARTSWSVRCCLCGKNDVHPSRLNIKRQSFYLRDSLPSATNPGSKKLGRMSTMVWNSETVTAHFYCLFFASSDGMIQTSQESEIELEGFPVEEILDQAKKCKKDVCVFCGKPGAASQCANLKCVNRRRDKLASGAGWYHFPCGLANGSIQEDGKTWCGRCSKGLRKAAAQIVKERPQQSLQRGPRKGGRGRGRKKVQISVPYQSSQSSQELFSNASQEQVFNMDTPRTSEGAIGCLDALLEPINAQQIWDEINFRRAERDKDKEEEGEREKKKSRCIL